MKTVSLGILLSGSGRTFLNLLDYEKRGILEAKIRGVISSKKQDPSNAHIFKVCAEEKIPIEIITADKSVDEYSQLQTDQLDQWEVDLICMAGYLKFWKIPPKYQNRVLNIHPALLPKYGGKGFYGMNVHRAVIAAGEKESGCTVHYADNIYDHGEIILQRKVTIDPNENPESLAAKVFQEECKAYPIAINQIIKGGYNG